MFFGIVAPLFRIYCWRSVPLAGGGLMFFDHTPIHGISYSPLYRTTLSALVVALLIGAQAAYAAGPTGCTVAGLPTNYFTDLQNVNSGSGTSSGTSLSSAETATAQVLEIVAERRSKAAEKQQICPIGSALVGGTCQPVRQNLSRTYRK
jgi:hypothetical protein